MWVFQTLVIILMVVEIDGHGHKKHHSHSHARKKGGKHSAGRGDKRTIYGHRRTIDGHSRTIDGHRRTIDDEKFDGPTQICGVPQNEQDLLANHERAKHLNLCRKSIVKKGCYKDASKEIGGKMLIDSEKELLWNVPNLRNIMFDFLCRCSETALEKGYALFGITNHFHCWGFNGTESDLRGFQKASDCVTYDADNRVPSCKESEKLCLGAVRNGHSTFISSISSYIYLAVEERDWSKLYGYKVPPSLFPLDSGPSQNGDKIDRDYATWESKVIPFDIDPNIDIDIASNVLRALYHLEKYTCVKFRRKMVDELMTSGYIHFQKMNTCYAQPGRRKSKPNEVNLASFCLRGAIVHELMHVLGFLNEQMREDRDKYIDIKFDNLQKTWPNMLNYQKGKKAFGDKYIGDEMENGTYDFNSLMHYPLTTRSTALAINPTKPVMELKEKWKKMCDKYEYGCIFGQWRGLSKSDAIRVNTIFKCQIKHDTCFKCPTYTKLDDFKTRYFQEFRKDLCLRLNYGC